MKTNWQKVRLGDVCVKITSGGTPLTKKSEYYSNGTIPWLRTQEVDFNRIYETEMKITELGLNNSSAKYIPANTVIVAMYGATAGKVAIAKIPLTTNQACCNIIIDSNKSEYEYIYYFLKNNYNKLLNLANGGAQQNLNAGIIANYPVTIPPLPTQRAIAATLSCLDDKIELNNRVNANLEAQAQAIFKSWFVDFEPFKGGGFVDSELGKIPKGWRVGTLGEFFPVITGKKNANIAGKTGEYPFFSCSQDILYTDNYSFEGNAILVAGNGDFNVKTYNGKFEAYQRTYVLIPNDEKLTGFLYFSIKFNLSEIINGFRGSVINFITKGHIQNFKMAIPVDLFMSETTPFFDMILKIIAQNNKQSRALAAIRDALLPRLMSGEIEVERE